MTGEQLHDDGWYDPARPPVEADKMGDGVWASWAAPWRHEVDGAAFPMIWHWCTRGMFIAARDRGDASEANRLPDWYRPQWVVAGCLAHTLVSSDPLTLDPSLLWSDCCGKHGYIRSSRWESA